MLLTYVPNQVKLNNGIQQFPPKFNIQDLEVIDFQNGDLSQGILKSLYLYVILLLLWATCGVNI